MEKQKIFYVLSTIILSILVFSLTLKLVFRTEKINEGKFRLTDAIVISMAELIDKTEENYAWSLNATQRNLISLLIMPATDARIQNIYISDLTANSKYPIVFYMLNDETKLTLNNLPQTLDVEYRLEENGTIKLEMLALNENILKDWRVPEGVQEIYWDGRIFNTAGISLEDLQFDLEFNLNIIEKNGKKNTLKVNITLPTKSLLETGADIRRLNKSQFKFKVN